MVNYNPTSLSYFDLNPHYIPIARRMLAEQVSYSKVAQACGNCSHATIARFARRCGLQHFQLSPAPTHKAKRRPRVRTGPKIETRNQSGETRVQKADNVSRSAIAGATLPPLSVAPVPLPRQFVTPRPVACCWVTNDRKPFRYCEAGSVPGQVYCEAHCRAAYPRWRARLQSAALCPG